VSPGSAITGWGACLPPKVVTNHDLSRTLDTSDEWISARTGIRARRVGGSTSSLAIGAGREALGRAGLAPGEVDHLVLATTTPDRQVPAASARVQQGLGLSCGAFDLNAACSGFVYALVVAHSLVQAGMGRVLVVGADKLSDITDWTDRSTAVLFGDGAGAVVLEATPAEPCLLAFDLGADGSAEPLIYCERGGFLHMDGQEVYRRAVRIMVASIGKVLELAGAKVGDVALFVPHQANARIIEAANRRLGIPMERTALVLDRTGNTSAASVPLALADAAGRRSLGDGDLVLMCGLGAGMTWGSALVRWGR
jgi:3-oxoacyl-[acyl-carrier-protein] synthase-3